MGERTYRVVGYDGEYAIGFSDEDDSLFGCLCTFPGNDQHKLTPDRVRELALLGAAVVLACHENELLYPVLVTDIEEFYVPLPAAVPRWMRAEIARIVGED
jgi:hypothetical protein